MPTRPRGFWHRRRVLVTGARGYTGQRLVRALAASGASVRAFLRGGASRPGFPAGIGVVTGDLKNDGDCRAAVEGADTVFNLAAITRRTRITRGGLPTIHVHAVESLTRAAQAVGCRRFVHTSTMGVHGHPDQACTEESPFAPSDDYEATKSWRVNGGRAPWPARGACRWSS